MSRDLGLHSSEIGYSMQVRRGTVSHQARLESALRRLQHLRMRYRFYILRFNECLSEDLVAKLMEAAASHAYHIRIDEQSFGVLDITKDHHKDHGEDIFLQDLLKRLEKQYRRLSGTGGVPMAVECIEGQTDEITGIEDLLYLAISQERREEPEQVGTEGVQRKYIAFG